jgi:hypothetical protein
LIHIEGGELGQRHRQFPALLGDEHEHISGANFFGRHVKDLDGFTFAERRNDIGSDASGLKWKLQLVFEVVIPSQRAFVGSVRVDDGLVVDSIFPNRIFLSVLYCLAVLLPRVQVSPRHTESSTIFK